MLVPLSSGSQVEWRGWDSNPRPGGYEPPELATALPRYAVNSVAPAHVVPTFKAFQDTSNFLIYPALQTIHLVAAGAYKSDLANLLFPVLTFASKGPYLYSHPSSPLWLLLLPFLLFTE